MPAAGSLAFDLRISLQYLAPEIWRLVRVPHDIRMDRFNLVIQVAFGWTDSHLHQFHLVDAKGRTKGFVGTPDSDRPTFGRRPPTQDETKRQLKNFLAKPGDYMGYEYDFGDTWLHHISLVAVQTQAARLAPALCLDGARACPPEDCGGPPGYEDLLAALADPQHPEYEEMKDSYGDLDPAAFDLRTTNRALARLKV